MSFVVSCGTAFESSNQKYQIRKSNEFWRKIKAKNIEHSQATKKKLRKILSSWNFCCDLYLHSFHEHIDWHSAQSTEITHVTEQKLRHISNHSKNAIYLMKNGLLFTFLVKTSLWTGRRRRKKNSNIFESSIQSENQHISRKWMIVW